MDRIESARMGAALLLFAVLLATVVIVGSNGMAAYNPVLDRIYAEEMNEESVTEAKPASDCGLKLDAYQLLMPATHMTE